MTRRVLAAVVPAVLVLSAGCSSSPTSTETPTSTTGAPAAEHNMDNMQPSETMPMDSGMPMNH